MDGVSGASAITALAAARTACSTLDDINSADRNIQDYQNEIEFVSAELDAINSLLRTATQASGFIEFPHKSAQDMEAGLARFKNE